MKIMKFLTAALLLAAMLFCTSCSFAVVGKPTADGEVSVKEEVDVTKDLPAAVGGEYNSAIGKKATMGGFLKIVSYYNQSIGAIVSDITEGEKVDFASVFPYFQYCGCMDDMNGGVRADVAEYYDAETSTFTVPASVAEDFLCERFDTEPDHGIDYYDDEHDAYVFKAPLGCREYTNEVLGYVFDYSHDESGTFTLDVSRRPSLDEDFFNLPRRAVYKIGFNNGSYRFISVKSCTPIMITDGDGNALSYNRARIENLPKEDGSVYQLWWFIEVPDTGEYTLHPLADPAKCLCADDSRLGIRERSNCRNAASLEGLKVTLESEAGKSYVGMGEDSYIDPSADGLVGKDAYRWNITEYGEK